MSLDKHLFPSVAKAIFLLNLHLLIMQSTLVY